MTGIIVLAAGSSSRLGQAKQQLVFQGQTLLQRALQAATASEIFPVVMVLGANAEAILPQIKAQTVHVVLNPAWAEGMASSIRAGLTQLQAVAPNVSEALIMLCDQPFVTAELLKAMVQLNQKSDKRIVACSYQDTLGAPVLFDQDFFPELLLLQGQEGAKKVLMKHPDDVVPLPFPQGAVDIDTYADYESLLQQNKVIE